MRAELSPELSSGQQTRKRVSRANAAANGLRPENIIWIFGSGAVAVRGCPP